jgi:hypothetical protein
MKLYNKREIIKINRNIRNFIKEIIAIDQHKKLLMLEKEVINYTDNLKSTIIYNQKLVLYNGYNQQMSTTRVINKIFIILKN